ncbi:MAG: caspase family protein [Bacteroidota bacterium]
MPQLHALLVGINTYDPRSNVRPLRGCHNDVKAIQQLLKTQYTHLNPQIKVLKDQRATREKLIQNFRKHLAAKAQARDLVLFYFSGHGSRAEAAPAFRQLDSTGIDETLVCYDSRTPGKYDLADKELAVLLSEVSSGVEVVVIIDSCHSGEMTKSIDADLNGRRSRFTSQVKGYRDLSTYLLSKDNYYTQQLATRQDLQIPHRAHVVLGACGRDQEAWEADDDRGVFTKHLIDCLSAEPGLSYQDLFLKVRARVQREVRKQDPQFGAYDGFDHRYGFLTRRTASDTRRHLIQFVEGKWRLQLGAIHGLPNAPDLARQIQLAIYPNLGKQAIAQANLEAVQLKESTFPFPEGDPQKAYLAEIVNFPLSMPVYLRGSQRAKGSFRKLYAQRPSPFLRWVDETESSRYELAIDRDRLLVYERESQTLLHGRMGKDGLSIDYIVGILETIEEWERLADLENKGTRFKAKDIELCFYRETESGTLEPPLKGPAISIEAPSEGAEGAIWYQLKATNHTDRELYFALLDLDSDYSTKNVYPCKKVAAQSEALLEYDTGVGFRAEDEAEELTKVFKLLVSTTPFDDYSFAKEGFELGKVDTTKEGRTRYTFTRKRATETDWCTRTIRLRLLRGTRLVGAEVVRFESEKIEVKAHPKFRAKWSFTELQSRGKSVHPLSGVEDLFRSEELELLDWNAGRSRSVQGQRSIIELSGVKGQAALRDEPLEVIIDQDLAAEEYLLPITMDEGFVFTFGESEKDATGKTHLRFRELPLQADPSRRRSRSIPRALWFVVLKVGGFRSRVFRLRYVTYNQAGKVRLSDRAIKSKVANASKILLLIHGIIGNTKSMARNLRFLLDQKHYDLILTFDYENLNEELEKTAQEFSKALKGVGLNARDGKTLDIVAHSMGGLVSRQMIERVRKGDRLVDRLLMFGTPNGGSAFGSIPQYRDLLTQLLSLALNFGKGWLGTIYPYLAGINKALLATSPLTLTLDQMRTDSDFVTDLYADNDPEVDPHTRYYTVAGDISDYKSLSDRRLARFLDKAKLKVGDWVYGEEPNDIAVSVAMIHHVPTPYAAEHHDVTAHHMNYFEEGEGLEKLKELLLGLPAPE